MLRYLKKKKKKKNQEEIQSERRKRNLLVLIHSYLQDQGWAPSSILFLADHVKCCSPIIFFFLNRFLDTLQALRKEAGPVISRFQVCDNIDLLTILQVKHSLGTRPFRTTWKGSGDTCIIQLSRSPEILGKPQLLRHTSCLRIRCIDRQVVACCAHF